MSKTDRPDSVPWPLSDGTTLQVSELTDRDHDELDAWVRGLAINAARLSVPPDAPAALFDRVLGVAMREVLGLTWMHSPGSAFLNTLEGSARLAWHSIRRKHPALTTEELRSKLSDVRNLIAFRHAFRQVNGLQAEDAPAKETDTRPT